MCVNKKQGPLLPPQGLGVHALQISKNEWNIHQNYPDTCSSTPGGSRELPGGVQEGPGGLLEGSLSQVGPDVPLGTLLGPFLEPSWSPSGPLLGHLEPP